MAAVTPEAIERGREASRRWRRENAPYHRKLVKLWQAAHPEHVKRFRKTNLIHTIVGCIQEKLGVIDAYGGKCACCGESLYEFMTIDHVNNDGGIARKWGRGTNLYKWLRRLGYPQKDYQLLCWNCNCAKGKYGYCPHKFEKVYGLSGC